PRRRPAVAKPRGRRGPRAGQRRRAAGCREEPDLQPRRRRAHRGSPHRGQGPSSLPRCGDAIYGRASGRFQTEGRVEPQSVGASGVEAADRLRRGRGALHRMGAAERDIRPPSEPDDRVDRPSPAGRWLPGVDTAVMPFAWRTLLLIPVVGACVYWIATAVVMTCFFRRRAPTDGSWLPTVSLIKPVCGLEKHLYENLSTACRQDYPEYEVIFSVQDPADPALAVLTRIRDENPSVAIRIVVGRACAGPNGRLSNILNATGKAIGEVLVYSDSDMRLDPQYLRAIVAPLANPGVGVACTLYRASDAENLYESLELLSLNTDFVPSMVFASETGASLACPGASQAIRRETLTLIGGPEPMPGASSRISSSAEPSCRPGSASRSSHTSR